MSSGANYSLWVETKIFTCANEWPISHEHHYTVAVSIFYGENREWRMPGKCGEELT